MLHSQFDRPHLQSTDPHLRVSAIDEEVAIAKAHQRAVTTLHKTLTATLAEVEAHYAQERGDRRGLQERGDDLREALAQLQRGVTAADGTLPEVSPFVGTAGVDATREAIAELAAQRIEWVELRDHANDLGTYRLRPDVGSHYTAPGVRMFPGETTQLTLRQFRAFADKFEPVEVAELPAPPAETAPADVSAAG